MNFTVCRAKNIQPKTLNAIGEMLETAYRVFNMKSKDFGFGKKEICEHEDGRPKPHKFLGYSFCDECRELFRSSFNSQVLSQDERNIYIRCGGAIGILQKIPKT